MRIYRLAMAALASIPISVSAAGQWSSYLGVSRRIVWSGLPSISNSLLHLTATVDGTATLSGSTKYVVGYAAPINLLSVTSDSLNASDVDLDGATSAVDALTVNHQFGGANAKGSRDGIDVNLELTSATGNVSENPYNAYYNGVIAAVRADTSDGGTAARQIGDLYGLSAQVSLRSGATYFAGIHGGQWDIAVQRGASVTNKTGFEISLAPEDAVQGKNLDNAILFSSNSKSGPGWKKGIAFGTPVGQGFWPFAPTATLIGTYNGTGIAANGTDWSAIKFTECAYKSRNFCVDGEGHLIFSQIKRPTVTCTGIGVDGRCDVTSAGHSTDSAGEIVVSTGTSPSASGVVTLSFAKPMGRQSAVCQFMKHKISSAWPVPTDLSISAENTSSVQIAWNSGATALAALTAYGLDYICVGR